MLRYVNTTALTHMTAYVRTVAECAEGALQLFGLLPGNPQRRAPTGSPFCLPAIRSDAVWSRRVYQPRPGVPLASFPADVGTERLWLSFQPPFHTLDRKSVWATIFRGGPHPTGSTCRCLVRTQAWDCRAH